MSLGVAAPLRPELARPALLFSLELLVVTPAELAADNEAIREKFAAIKLHKCQQLGTASRLAAAHEGELLSLRQEVETCRRIEAQRQVVEALLIESHAREVEALQREAKNTVEECDAALGEAQDITDTLTASLRSVKEAVVELHGRLASLKAEAGKEQYRYMSVIADLQDDLELYKSRASTLQAGIAGPLGQLAASAHLAVAPAAPDQCSAAQAPPASRAIGTPSPAVASSAGNAVATEDVLDGLIQFPQDYGLPEADMELASTEDIRAVQFLCAQEAGCSGRTVV